MYVLHVSSHVTYGSNTLFEVYFAHVFGRGRVRCKTAPVHVRVDESGHDKLSRCIGLTLLEFLFGIFYLDYFAVFNVNGLAGYYLSVFGIHDVAVVKHQFVFGIKKGYSHYR